MSGISFYTPVEFGAEATFGQKVLELVDGYLNFGSRVAVVIPGSIRNGSYEVAIQWKETSWLKTALKVLSYATIVIPFIMLVAKAALRSTFLFHTCGRNPIVQPEEHYDLRPKAPLTLVRTPLATDLKISVLYNQIFAPQDPIEPKPSEIGTDGKYSWKVATNGDGTMSVDNQRINMIWWEAIRRGVSSGVDPSKAVCVERSKLKEFLEGVLRKVGVHDGELEAFTNYWKEILRQDSENSPFVLVEMVSPSELRKYIPEMEIEGENAGLFDLKRFYFRFESAADASKGISPASYLGNLEREEFGEHAVIDLGGEVIGDVTRDWEPAFNQEFIGRYIYAG